MQIQISVFQSKLKWNCTALEKSVLENVARIRASYNNNNNNNKSLHNCSSKPILHDKRSDYHLLKEHKEHINTCFEMEFFLATVMGLSKQIRKRWLSLSLMVSILCFGNNANKMLIAGGRILFLTWAHGILMIATNSYK